MSLLRGWPLWPLAPPSQPSCPAPVYLSTSVASLAPCPPSAETLVASLVCCPSPSICVCCPPLPLAHPSGQRPRPIPCPIGIVRHCFPLQPMRICTVDPLATP
eukprot:scaffold29194_cov122-Isochrysis_galbana.AAC.4